MSSANEPELMSFRISISQYHELTDWNRIIVSDRKNASNLRGSVVCLHGRREIFFYLSIFFKIQHTCFYILLETNYSHILLEQNRNKITKSILIPKDLGVIKECCLISFSTSSREDISYAQLVQ